MNEVEILKIQTISANSWLLNMIDSVPQEKWYDMAEGINSSIAWQVGHQIVSIYYHSVMTTVGHKFDVIEKLNLKWYTEMCTYDSSPEAMHENVSPKILREHLVYMQKTAMDVLESLSVKNLQEQVEPTKMKHPVARTKFEAIDWNIKHIMWHCGQISSIKRIIHTPYDFGIKKPV